MLRSGFWFTEEHEDAGSAFSMKVKDKLEEVRTPYQKIEVYETSGFGNLMVIDGYVMLTSRDNFLYHEMMAHPVLFTHERPRRVCIIGGGDCGTLREVLRHPAVEEAVQVDIDEQVTRLSERFFPELCESNQDPRARLLFQDGIRWMKQRDPGSLDVIIVDSTDPIGPAEGLFSADFFTDCIHALADGGLLVQQSESPLYHMDILRGMYGELKKGGFQDMRTLFFPQCVYPSGWWSATMARKGGDIEGFREADVEARTFPTRYYNLDIHRASLAAPEFFKTQIHSG